MKLCQDIRKRFFAEGVVSPCNRLRMDVVMAISLSEVKEYLDNAVNIWFSFTVL